MEHLFCGWYPCGSVVKNLPMQETWLQILGWEDPLEKEMAIHSGILAWRISWTRSLGAAVHGAPKELDTT